MDVDVANRVLEQLYDRAQGSFSLDELADKAGVGRAGVDDAIDALRQRGHDLEIRPAGGVRLVRPVRLDPHLIERDLGTTRVGRTAICFDEVDSTNDVAMASWPQAEVDGLVVLAEYQRSGRGRQGRQWISRPGANVLMSAMLADETGRLTHEALPIAAGLAVAEGVTDACKVGCGLKWPNDVLLDGAKVAGVLVETRRHGRREAIVIGVGINVNAAPPVSQVTAAPTCLADRLGGPVERTEIVRAVLRRLDAWLANVIAGHTDLLHQAWTRRCRMINQRVTIACAGQTYVGRVLDVSPLVGLILGCDDGRQVHLPAESSTLISQ